MNTKFFLNIGFLVVFSTLNCMEDYVHFDDGTCFAYTDFSSVVSRSAQFNPSDHSLNFEITESSLDDIFEVLVHFINNKRVERLSLKSNQSEDLEKILEKAQKLFIGCSSLMIIYLKDNLSCEPKTIFRQGLSAMECQEITVFCESSEDCFDSTWISCLMPKFLMPKRKQKLE